MKNIKLYNSLTNKIEDFKTIKENEVSMYVCGPTVYNHMHIGNARPVIFFDTVKKFLEYIGYNVKMVSNFTDIDDKIIKKAQEENISEEEVSTKYIDAYLNACEKIGCSNDVEHPKVTENIENIVEFIDELVKKLKTNAKKVFHKESQVRLIDIMYDDINQRLYLADCLKDIVNQAEFFEEIVEIILFLFVIII